MCQPRLRDRRQHLQRRASAEHVTQGADPAVGAARVTWRAADRVPAVRPLPAVLAVAGQLTVPGGDPLTQWVVLAVPQHPGGAPRVDTERQRPPEPLRDDGDAAAVGPDRARTGRAPAKRTAPVHHAHPDRGTRRTLAPNRATVSTSATPARSSATVAAPAPPTATSPPRRAGRPAVRQPRS